MILALILVAYVASLGRALDYGLVWDDVPEIQDSAAFDRPLGHGLLLTQVERGAGDLAGLDALQFTYDSYRPVTFASYWIDIALWGRSPRALHGTSIVLGAIVIALAFLVVRRWLGPQLAWIPTTFFALHPVQIEAVAYVSGRGDLLAALFALGATYAVLRGSDAASWRNAALWVSLAVVAFAASLLAKESYIGLPVALGVLLMTRRERLVRWWIPAMLLVVAIAYLPLRAAMIEVREPAPILDAITGLPRSLVDALRIVMLPFDLSIERKLQTSTLMAWGVLAGIALLLVASWRCARCKGATWTHGTIVLSGLSWFALLLGPSSIVVERTGIVADRYLFLPMLGVAVVLAALIAALTHADVRPLIRRGILAAGVVWAAIVLVVAWTQVPVWRDQSSLYRQALAMERTSASAHYRVAVVEIQLERWDLAGPLLERAIELDPQHVQALNDLGVYRLRIGRADEAMRLLERAVTANPGRFRAWTNLGLAQLAMGNRAAGCSSIARALAINPNYATARRARAQSCAP
jgi:hypothetical protein